MAEEVRKRKSKWDVVAETRIPTEIGPDDVLPVKVDDFVKDQGSNSDGNCSHSKWSAIRADNSLLYKDGSDAYQSSKLCGPEEVHIKVAENCLGMPQFPECSDMEAGNADGSKIACREPMPGNQTTTNVGKMSPSLKHPYVEADDDIDGSKKSQWEPIPGNQTTSNDGNMSLSPKHPDVEADIKDGSKKSHWEPIPGNQTTEKYSSSADGWENRSAEKSGSGLDGRGHLNIANDGRVADGWGTAANSYRTSASPGLDPRRQRGLSNSPRSSWSRSHRGRSRSGSWSRSRSSRSRSRSRSSRSRSRSPFLDLKREPQRWSDRGRMGARGPPCRDFAAGRCRRGSQCRFVHEDGDRNHFEIGTRDTRDSRYERGRYLGHEIKGNFMNTREHRDYSRDRPSQRHRSHYDGDWEKPELHRNNRSSQPCFDFIKGKCIRGSSCRYVHHEASSDGGRHRNDEARERSRDRRDANSSFGWRPEPHRAGKLPCKYFAEGHCSRGEGCKFSHHGLPHGSLDSRPQDGTGHISQHLQTQNPRENIDHMLPQDAPQQALASQEQNIIQETSGQYPCVPAITTQAMAGSANIQQHLGSIEGVNIVPNNIISQAKMDSVSSPFNVVGIPAQHFAQNGPNQCVVPQPLPMQNFAPNVQFQQFVPPLPFNVPIHQAYPPSSNGQNQFAASHVPPNNQIFNATSMQSQPVPTPPHNGQSQHNFNLGGQIQHNVPAGNRPDQRNYNVNVQTQNVCLPHNAHNQPSYHQIDQIQQGLTLPYNGQNQHNINISGQSQQILPLPQGGPIQQIAHSAAPNGQNYYGLPQPVPSPQNFNSGIQGHQRISQHQANTHHQAQAGVKESVPDPGITEIIPSQSSTDTLIVHKVVTSEQAAQITNLSASLAHFFGNGPQLPELYAALNPQSATGQEPLQPFLNPSAVGPPAPAEAPHIQPSQESSIQKQPDPISDSADPEKLDTSNIPPGFSSASVEQKDPKLESQTIMKSSAPALTIDETNDANQKNHEPKQIEVDSNGGAAPKEVNDTEIDQIKKEQTATHSEDMDTDVRVDEGKRSKDKDSKSNRMFKCALVEFVKNALKPAWKEGHLSKEVHKTIVKKVVDKVTGAMQNANIPQTQEKIDIYMEYSKVKLGKLVQAYLEKYV